MRWDQIENLATLLVDFIQYRKLDIVVVVHAVIIKQPCESF